MATSAQHATADTPRPFQWCPGEDVTLTVLETLIPRLAALRYEVPAQDLRISLQRIPTAPRSGFVMATVL
ncbi:hypothetical protein ABZ341_43460 [Streptomyces sp. NPDC006173]|uniref:hypothetical protein n=1 Tax=Streptomyces sp. NPDC006173 TaxID=3155349 RepID=UPI003402DB3C